MSGKHGDRIQMMIKTVTMSCDVIQSEHNYEAF